MTDGSEPSGRDLFGHAPAQGSLFGDDADRITHAPALTYRPVPADIRRRFHATLATAREAARMPWDERGARKWRIMFPQMANWLPAEEADQLRFNFARELERLAAAG